MRLLFAYAGAVAFALVSAGPVSAQTIPGKNLTVDIEVAAASMRGDTTRLTYLLTNRPTSAEVLFQFTVDAPAPATLIFRPEPRADWYADRAFIGRSVAAWVVLNRQMGPGTTSPGLSFDAVGLAGLVDSWVRGNVPLEMVEEAVDDSVDTLPPPPIPDLYALSIKTTTVGVSPIPSGATTAALLTRLDSLTHRTCNDLAWISSASVCTTLDSHLGSASTAVAANDNGGARTALSAFVSDLDRGRFPPTGTPTLSGSAYWLLRTNATFILGRIPAP